MEVEAYLIHEMNGYAPAIAAAVLQQRIRQWTDRAQIQSGSVRHILREQANTTFSDVAV